MLDRKKSSGNKTANRRLPALSENMEQRDLFEQYVAMGKGRTLKKLLPLTKKKWITVQHWSVKFNWARRAQERDKEAMETYGLESPTQNLANKKLALDIVNKMIQDIAVLDTAGNVIDTTLKAKNVFDLRTLVDVRDEILGLKDKADRTKAQTNIEKAVFIIKK